MNFTSSRFYGSLSRAEDKGIYRYEQAASIFSKNTARSVVIK